MCPAKGVLYIVLIYSSILNFTVQAKTYYFHVNKTNNEFMIYNRGNLSNSFSSQPSYTKVYLSELRNNITRYKNNTSGVQAHPFLDLEWDYDWKNVTRHRLPSYIHKLYETMAREMTSTARVLFNIMPQNSTIIKFNLSNIDETVSDVELHFHNTVEKKLLQKSLILRLYHVEDDYINETSLINPDANKLLNVIYVSQAENEWQVFKLTNTIKDRLKIRKNLILLITISKPNEEQFTVFKDINKDVFRTFLILKSEVAKNEFPGRNGMTVFNSNPCQKHDLYISFEKLNWMKFIVAPSGYNAFNCYGRCYKGDKLANYIKVTSFIPEISRKSLCCVPVDYLPLLIMFYDKNGDIAIKMYNEMIVSECLCR